MTLAKDSPEYSPNRLLNTLIEKMDLKNDAALSRKLEVSPAMICNMRLRRVVIGPTILIAMHEESELSIRELKALLGVHVAPPVAIASALTCSVMPTTPLSHSEYWVHVLTMAVA